MRFFNGTPVHHLPPPENFTGTGVYALYYTGRSPYYKPLFEMNRVSFSQPIYVGKAVPAGWRQGRTQEARNELFRRLCDHNASICQAENLDIADFYCRFMILEGTAADIIGTVEAALIRYYTPIWNNAIDGFGNHDPGSGRYEQAVSGWDVLHPGRLWAKRLNGGSLPIGEVEEKVKFYFENLEQNHELA